MNQSSFYGQGIQLAGGIDIGGNYPLDYRALINSWDAHEETRDNNGEEVTVTVYDIDAIPMAALYVGMLVSDNTTGTVKALKEILEGAESAHECVWQKVGTKADWNAESGTDAEILNKPNFQVITEDEIDAAFSGVDLTEKYIVFGSSDITAYRHQTEDITSAIPAAYTGADIVLCFAKPNGTKYYVPFAGTWTENSSTLTTGITVYDSTNTSAGTISDGTIGFVVESEPQESGNEEEE